MTAKPSPVTLTWTCQVCGFPIADRAGYLHVDLAKVGQHEAAKIAFEDKHRQGGFVGYSAAEWIDEMPPMPRWRIHHRACDPDPDATDYCIDVESARTHASLLDWTAHLLEKSWLRSTTWDDLIRDAAAGGA